MDPGPGVIQPQSEIRCKLAAGAPMTEDRSNYLLWTGVLRDDGARLSYVFPDDETESEPMVEAVLTEPAAEPSVVNDRAAGRQGR